MQILKGLEYLHSQDPPVIHRDLKCENIFINGTSGDLRIGDLGLSTVHNNGRVLSVLGTPEFMAPDMYEECSYDQRVDIYAFGMCMLEIFTKEIPYKECKNPAQIYKKVSSGELPEILSRLRSRHARDFVMLCLGHKNENGEYIRPTAKELLTHEFLIKRANDEDEVLVDPPLIKRTIIENETLSPINSGWPVSSQIQTRQYKAETVTDKAPSATPANDQGSADGDESDRFDEMPDSEVIDFRKVKVLMGRGQELKEDEEPLVDTSGRSIDGSTQSHTSSDRLPDPNNQTLKNGIPALRASKKVNVGPSLQVTQPGHYLVAAAVIENEAALAYPDDILKLVVTLPVEGQTQNVQFDFHLVEDDPVQVGKEMVSELGIPQGAVLEISETISGLACAARMQRDKHKMRAQQNSQAQVAPTSQHIAQSSQMAGTPQDMQAGMSMQQPPPMSSEYSNSQPRQSQQGSRSGDQIQRQQTQPQLSQPSNPSQANQIPAEQQSQSTPYIRIQSQGQGQHQHQIQGQLQNQVNSSHFGFDPGQGKGGQQPQIQAQHGNSLSFEAQSLPAYGYEGGRHPNENHSLQPQPPPPAYSYDPGQAQSQGQPPPLQPQHLHQHQTGIPDMQFHYDGQQHQGQLNQGMGQQAALHMGQQNQMPPQQAAVPNQSQQPQMQANVQAHPNGQLQQGNHSLPQGSQIQGHAGQGGNQGQPQSFGHVPHQSMSSQLQDLQHSTSHGAEALSQQAQQQPATQPQHQTYASSPPQQPQQNAESGYEHGVSLPNALSQHIGIPTGGGLKRSVSTNSHNIPGSQQLSMPVAAQAAPQGVVPPETRRPPSRSSSGCLPNMTGHSGQAAAMHLLEDEKISGFQDMPSDVAARAFGFESGEEDGDGNEELRKLDEDFQKNLQRAKKVFYNRMDNLQRSQIEREAQHQKTLERHQKERAEFEKRLQQEEKEQNRRIEQLQREWDRRREVLSKNKRRESEDEGSVSAEVSVSSLPPEAAYAMPESTANEQAELSLNQTASNDSDR